MDYFIIALVCFFMCIYNFSLFIRFLLPSLFFTHSFGWGACVARSAELLSLNLPHTRLGPVVPCKLAAGLTAWAASRSGCALSSRGKQCLSLCGVSSRSCLLPNPGVSNPPWPKSSPTPLSVSSFIERSYAHLLVYCLWMLLPWEHDWVVLTVLCTLPSWQYLLSPSLQNSWLIPGLTRSWPF